METTGKTPQKLITSGAISGPAITILYKYKRLKDHERKETKTGHTGDDRPCADAIRRTA